MIAVIKTLGILCLELVIYYILGTVGKQIIAAKTKRNTGLQLIFGFLLYQILFQICALPFIWQKKSLTELAYFWLAFAAVLFIFIVLKFHKEIEADIDSLLQEIKEIPWVYLCLIIISIIMCWYISLNGELNDDSLYYIGLVNTTLTTDTMYCYNVYTGMALPSLYARRMFVTFEMNAAVLCKIFEIHPIVLMRIFRGCLNVILTNVSIYMLGRAVFKGEHNRKKALAVVCTSMLLYFVMNDTIYTNAEFFLHRTYEGKAYAGNVLIYTTIYICIQLMQTLKKQYLLLILLLAWSAMAISSSAVMVCLATAGVLLGAFAIYQWCNRKRKRKTI